MSDYSCKVGDRPKRYGGGQSVSVEGRPGILWLRPKGYCVIKFGKVKEHPQLRAQIDLRTTKNAITDAGKVTVYRRAAVVRWLEIPPPLLDFLSSRFLRTLSLEHIDRVRKPKVQKRFSQ